MLHEILLSLSGHPSPLLRSDLPSTSSSAGLTPPERQLLGTAAHLSDLHVKVITSTAQISTSHPSPVCRAVASAIDSLHLAAFQKKVLEVEASILKDDAKLVGAYNIVPLTAVMGEFRPWTRRMEWLWELAKFMTDEKCHAAAVMDRLRRDLLSGYKDIEETAMSLVAVAEAAWLKQVSAWILYGRLPSFGGQDFFVQKADATDGSEFTCDETLLPSFVTTRAASSMLFIGKSLNHVRVKSTINAGLRGLDHLTSKLRELSDLKFPLDSASFSRTITSIRLSLSETTLQKILPVSKVVEMLQLLRDFFLLGRGEFAMALAQEADEKIRNRWRQAGKSAYEKADDLSSITVKDGEVAAVLARTWQVLASRESQHAEEDELQELARDLLRLHINKSKLQIAPGPGLTAEAAKKLADSAFQNLLFSTPVVLSLELPSPLDMVLSLSELQQYSVINAYLLAMRRAHIRLTDLWKIASLRRHHPAPRGAGEFAVRMRERWTSRMSTMKSSWTTASAAIFFLGETEAYLQTEIVAVLWDGYLDWLMSSNQPVSTDSADVRKQMDEQARQGLVEQEEHDDYWLQNIEPKLRISLPSSPPHDPQTLSTAHKLYLNTLTHRLLLTQPTYTEPLYTLLSHIDHLVTHIHRLHSIYTSIDLETDAGVVDAFVDLHAEEVAVTQLLRGVETKVKQGIGDVVAVLRKLEVDDDFAAQWESTGVEEAVEGGEEEVGYVPARVGGINRLLMKLDFGSCIWA